MATTRNDVAQRAGVSPAVVSYVLNDGPRPVSAAARARVLEAVAELGYRPDGLARSLRMGTTHTLGLLVPDSSNPFFAELARSVEDAAFARGYGVLVCNSADDSAREKSYIARLAGRRIDGLIVVSSNGSQGVTDVTDLDIPVVGLDRSPDESPVSTIRTDNEEGVFLGTRHLIEHGHHRIAFVGGPDHAVTEARLLGWRRALDDAGIEAGPIARTPFTFGGGRDAAGLLGTAPDITAILVSSDIQALGLLRGLRDRGSRVPDDVAVVSFDGTAAGEFSIPALTTIAQPIAEMGDWAVAHLIAKTGDTVHVALGSHLVRRESCGCRAAAT